jgi:xanthine dehydrogenase iron-sulfur cluster and FAD-binding subunit A
VGDTLPLLLVLDASLWLQSDLEIRQIPFKDFFVSYRKTALNKGEIIKEIIIPPVKSNSYIKFTKTSKSKSVDISSVITAVKIEYNEDFIINAALALGGVSALPMLSQKFTELLTGKKLSTINIDSVISEVEKEFEPLTDIRGTALYRKKLIQNHILLYFQELQKEEK